MTPRALEILDNKNVKAIKTKLIAPLTAIDGLGIFIFETP